MICWSQNRPNNCLFPNSAFSKNTFKWIPFSRFFPIRTPALTIDRIYGEQQTRQRNDTKLIKYKSNYLSLCARWNWHRLSPLPSFHLPASRTLANIDENRYHAFMCSQHTHTRMQYYYYYLCDYRMELNIEATKRDMARQCDYYIQHWSTVCGH